MIGRAVVLTLLVLIGTAAMRSALAVVDGGRERVEITLERWPCAEDEPYLIGRGDFDGERWARYRCVHVNEIGG
jgi:hypothetical protein